MSEDQQPAKPSKPLDAQKPPAEGAPTWQFKSEGAPPAGSSARGKSQTVEWTASEFIAHHKGLNWYAALVGVAIVLAAFVFWFTRDKISTGIVLFMAFIFGVSAAQKPRVLNYRLDEVGLHIQQKMYPYNLFKSFSVVDEGAFSSVSLLPLKRFMPAIAIYYDPKDETKILNMLSVHLPLDPTHHDPLERLMRRIRF